MSDDPSPQYYASSLPLIVGSAPHIRVTAQSHPLAFAAFEAISADSGFLCGRDVYAVPEAWAERLAKTESALALLTDATERENFLIGDQEEAGDLIARHPDLAIAHDLLDAFFDGEDKIHGPLDDAA